MKTFHVHIIEKPLNRFKRIVLEIRIRDSNQRIFALHNASSKSEDYLADKIKWIIQAIIIFLLKTFYHS